MAEQKPKATAAKAETTKAVTAQEESQATSTEVVYVGCKLPHGIFISHAGTRYRLKGRNDSAIINGHGITEVPKAFWEAWKEANSDLVALKNELIFAHASKPSVKDHAKDNAENPTGTEGINPAKPGRGVQPRDETE